MISENYKLAIMIINRFIQMGQKKTQGLIVLLYQTTIAIFNVILNVRLIFTAEAKAVDLTSFPPKYFGLY